MSTGVDKMDELIELLADLVVEELQNDNYSLRSNVLKARWTFHSNLLTNIYYLFGGV
ncbi:MULTISPECIES: hypothetical protein [unclassified Staphylococcus]|uniref:hypothetical protein n=1 Tax=unclassified Staphylococcus TaxID=91994 RepID=UPI001AEC6896|nr:MULTISPECIES: hypothetical protein [unclassified Staphylococcus]